MTGCLNGGSCRFDKKNETFTCSCKPPWSGDGCEVKHVKGKPITLSSNYKKGGYVYLFP